MKKGFIFTVLALLVTVQPLLAGTSSTRVIPAGALQVIEDGQTVERFNSEMPLPQGRALLCEGSCVIQSQGLQLVAADQSLLAMAESEDGYELAVKKGQIDFAFASQVKGFTITTPSGQVTIKEVVVPAASQGLVQGSIGVGPEGSDLRVTEGALRIDSAEGVQYVRAGQSFQLAQSNVVGGDDDEGGGGDGAGAAGDGAGAAGLATIGATMGLVAVGIAAADDDDPTSPSTP